MRFPFPSDVIQVLGACAVSLSHPECLVFLLQELIQNAEDAGAKVIRFLYDKHSYGQDKQQLYNPGLARFQVCLKQQKVSNTTNCFCKQKAIKLISAKLVLKIHFTLKEIKYMIIASTVLHPIFEAIAVLIVTTRNC